MAAAQCALMHAAGRLLGVRHVGWLQAMKAEMSAVDDEREALAFAWGCFLTALGYAVTAARGAVAQVHNAGLLAGSVTVLLGCTFMHSAGAPNHYVWMNLLSLAVAVTTFRLLPLGRLQSHEVLRAKMCFAMGALLLVVSLAASDASGWVRVGSVPLNLTWLLLPVLLVGADAHAKPAGRLWALVGVGLAVIALALQADPVLAAVTGTVLALRSWNQRSPSLALLAMATGALSVHAAQGWQAPAFLPFVDRVLLSGFAQDQTVGLALVLLQVLPLWPALRHPKARWHGLVWALLMAVSVPGWVPSPLLGFGGSFIVAYMLSLALIDADASKDPDIRPDARMRPATAHRHWDPPTLPRSGLT